MKPLIMFPDSEKLIIKAINRVLFLSGETGIRVAVRKTTAQEPPAAKQITVRSDGGTIFQHVLKEESLGLNLFVQNSNRLAGYAEANRLAVLLEAILPMAASEVPQIKHLSVNSITPIETDTEEQQRYIRITAVLRGSQLLL